MISTDPKSEVTQSVTPKQEKSIFPDAGVLNARALQQFDLIRRAAEARMLEQGLSPRQG